MLALQDIAVSLQHYLKYVQQKVYCVPYNYGGQCWHCCGYGYV